MNNKCLYCYEDLGKEKDFHEKCSMEFFGMKKAPDLPYSLDQMAELAKNVVEKSVSVPGVQAKLSMTLVKEARKQTNGRLTVAGALGGKYIFKPPSEDYPEMPENEHVSMRIAETFGISVVPSSLIKLQSGELAYITRRIDRTEKGDKIHMLDMFQILEAFDKYKGSMEKIGKALGDYSSNTMLDKLFFFELTLFSFLMGNNDMHLKNFSMINSETGWILSPAYDLLNVRIVIPEDSEELALSLSGKKKKFEFEHFENFGKGLGLNPRQLSGAFKRLLKNKAKAIIWIDRSFLSDELKLRYKSLIEDRYERILGSLSKS